MLVEVAAEAELRDMARRLGLENKVYFTGFVTDAERNRLLHIAKAAVFPSLYEPFGIVALEAMAAGTPVVVSDTGGLGDVVEHEINGLKMYAGDALSLANQVRALLKNPEWARSLAQTATAQIGRFEWNRIALGTINVYHRVLAERAALTGLTEPKADLSCHEGQPKIAISVTTTREQEDDL